MKTLFVLLFACCFYTTAVFACTTIIVGKDATADGSVIVTHSDDALGDIRVIYVPAMDHATGSKRPVYYDPCAFGSEGTRYVGTSRGPGYDDPNLPKSEPLGYIEQVPHTYAYFDCAYGIMNEHQLMIGECTDKARFEPKPVKNERIFYSAELSRVALERCISAREAVILIGKLMEEYGYYGTGETLLVGDTKEAWVIEMCAHPNGNDGIWVAQRVPDDGLFVAANEFRIREIDPDNPDMMYSKNLFTACQKAGWWKPSDGKLDWLKTTSPGEYHHPYYSLRRVWSVLARAKPSAKFSPWVEDGYTKDYPFSVSPDKKLSVQDVIALHRDHYEGTEFDLTKGLAAGPFGSPNRFEGSYDMSGAVTDPKSNQSGAWERPLSVYRCGYTTVNQGRSWLPDTVGGVCWLAPSRPYETCFVPFYVGIKDLPKSYQAGTIEKFDRNNAWWAFNFVSNWTDLKYSYMVKDIKAKQEELEGEIFAKQKETEKEAMLLYKNDPELARQYLTEYSINTAGKVVSQWWDLADYLIVKYSNGYVNVPALATGTGYPQWWLDKASYKDGPAEYKKK